MEIERSQHVPPPSYLLAEKITSSAKEDIPVVDLGNPNDELVAREVVKASEEWGIFKVVNHGIPTELIQRLKEVGKEFFDLSEAEKEAAVARPPDSKEIQGYTTNYRSPVVGVAWADHVFHRIWPPSRVNYKFWPNNPPEYKEVNEEYARQIKKLSERIMDWLSEGLGLQSGALKEGMGGETVEYLMKVIYYPAYPNLDDLVLGAPSHTDVSGMTFLISNEVFGLQARKDDSWIDVKYDNSGIIVIIGDEFSRMSNGRYKNVMHRAIMSKEKTRMSWPLFVESNNDHVFGPLPELISGDDTSKYKPYAYGDYKFRKFNKLPLD